MDGFHFPSEVPLYSPGIWNLRQPALRFFASGSGSGCPLPKLPASRLSPFYLAGGEKKKGSRLYVCTLWGCLMTVMTGLTGLTIAESPLPPPPGLCALGKDPADRPQSAAVRIFPASPAP